MNHSLGRGLHSLIPKKGTQSSPSAEPQQRIKDTDRIFHIDPHTIVANPHQPRTQFNDNELEELTASIRKHGILQPIVVTRKDESTYELIAGERRLRAAKRLNLPTIPALIRSHSELEKLELALIENIQRTNLGSMERARAYQKLADEFSLTHADIATRVGMSRAAVSNTLRFLDLPQEIQDALNENHISEGQAKILLELKNPAEQKELFKKIRTQSLTVAQVAAVVRDIKSKPKRPSSQNPIFAAYAEDLAQHLGTPVTIHPKGTGGIIKIVFYTQEELDHIVAECTAE